MSQPGTTLKIRTLLLLSSVLLLQGCIESSPSPSSDVLTPSKHKHIPTSSVDPLIRTSFQVPEETTRISSWFRQNSTPNWSDARNWTSEFYNEQGSSTSDYYQYVPCLNSSISVPHEITLGEGTSFLNESIDVKKLSLCGKANLSIPEGKEIRQHEGEVYLTDSKIKLDGKYSLPALTLNASSEITGNGDLVLTGNPTTLGLSRIWGGKIKIGDLSAEQHEILIHRSQDLISKPYFEINNGNIRSLRTSALKVNGRLDVKELNIDGAMDVDINHLHIRDDGYLRVRYVTQELPIQHLSFSTGATLRFEGPAEEDPEWRTVHITGKLDISNMQVKYNHLGFGSFGHRQVMRSHIGERFNLLTAHGGIVGDPTWLRWNRRSIVTGYHGDGNVATAFDSTYQLVWYDQDSLYVQSQMTMGGGGLFSDIRAEGRTLIDFGMSRAESEQVGQICQALDDQKKAIFENATESGIEAYLVIQQTVDPLERAQRLLRMFDVGGYLDEHGHLTEIGKQAIGDIFRRLGGGGQGGTYAQHFNGEFSSVGMTLSSSSGWMRGAIATPFQAYWDTATYLGWEGGVALGSQLNVSLLVSGSMRSSHPTSYLTALGLVYGMGSNLTGKLQMGYQHDAFRDVTVRGTAILVDSKVDSYTGDLHIQYTTRPHAFGMGAGLRYVPAQLVDTVVPEIGVYLKGLPLKHHWQGMVSLGYTYEGERGISVNTQGQLFMGGQAQAHLTLAVQLSL